MKSLFWAAAYVLFTIIVACIVPTVMMPIFQDLGLAARDVVGYCLALNLIIIIIMVGFGALMWSELR